MLENVAAFLNAHVPGCQARAEKREVGDSLLWIESAHVRPVCEALKNAPEYDMTTLQVITGCDYEDRIEVSYLLASFTKNSEIVLKTKLPKPVPTTVPKIESVCGVWKSANFQERECYDMLGVEFSGHPDPRRILCPDDWEGYPLRKDYRVQKEYNGMVVNPEDKINNEDHFFYQKLQNEIGDPKKVAFSWKEE